MADPLEEPDFDQVEEQAGREEGPDEIEQHAPQEEEREEEREKEERQDDRTVPLAALNEARHQIRGLKESLSQYEEKLKGVDEIRAQLDAYRKQQQEAEDRSAFDSDPLGALRRDIQTLREEQETERTQSAQRQAEAQQREALQAWAATQVQDFTREHPDYQERFEHVMNARAEELRLLGYPDEQVAQAIEHETWQIAEDARARGINPAEIVYNLAALRGYQPKQTTEKVEKLAKGQAASRSLSGSQGSAPDQVLSDISKMSDEEFDKYWDEKFG